MLYQHGSKVRGGVLQGFRLILDEVIIQVLVRWAVPCFIMISGYLLLNPKKSLSINRIKQYAFRMVIVLLIFGLFYCFVEAYLTSRSQSVFMFLQISVRNLLEGHSWAHMWFVYMIIGLYLITPLLRSFVQADEHTFRFVLNILFVFTVVCPTINQLFDLELAEILPISTAYMFYYLAGYYYGTKKTEIRKACIFLIIGIVCFVGMLCLKVKGLGVSLQPDNVCIAIYSVSLFVLCRDSSILNKISHSWWILFGEKYSFGIYITHMIFLNFLNKGLHVFPDAFPPIIGEGVFFAIALVGACIVSWVLCKIPPFRKVLLGK